MEKGQMEKENPAASAPSPPSYPGSPVCQNVVVNQGAPAAQPSFQIFVQPAQQNPPQYAPQQPPVAQPAQPIPPQYPPQQPVVHPGQQIPPQYMPQQPQIGPASPQYVVPQPQLVQTASPQYVVPQPQLVQTANQVVVVRPRPTEAPGQMICPHCQNTVVTVIKHENGFLTWLICGIIALFLFWPLCFIPFCVDSCKDVAHYCPACNNKLHVYKRR